MIDKILIANRGEIACRIIRTCKRLGLKTVAIYSDIDASAKHVQMADEAYALKTNAATTSYLDIDKIITIARTSGAKAIHPGYGFLSEKAAFAHRVEKEGLIFVGPSALAIEQMGDKEKAKALMIKAGVPVIPGYSGKGQSTKELESEAKKMGMPVMLKATAGGGGKGMRIVEDEKELSHAIESAKREAQASFADDTLMIEKYLATARHIEVQIIGDHHGQVVHLFERDCSLQRRHQKIIEEAPAPKLSEKTKQQLYKAAMQAAKAIDYTNAGTIEFLVTSEQDVYFLEMNTRLQVEHPITECITGIDLVEWQLLVASGEPLPLTQNEIKLQGHAFEARLYAEDPFNDFLPATGHIQAIHLPTDVEARYDMGIQPSDDIGIYYDPILAKVIVHGKTRKQALGKFKSVLSQMEIIGIINNIGFLRTIVQTQDFLESKVHTHYLGTHMEGLLEDLKQHSHALLMPALLAHVLHSQTKQKEQAEHSSDPNSPWHEHNAWALNTPQTEQVELIRHDHKITAHVQHLSNGFFVTCDELKQPELLTGTLTGERLRFEVSGKRQDAQVFFYEDHIHIFADGLSEVYDYETTETTHDTALDKDALVAPMPGIITNIWVKPGSNVEKGDKLLAMEAMKMEHTLSAQKQGQIKSIYYNVGDQVQQGCALFEFESDA